MPVAEIPYAPLSAQVTRQAIEALETFANLLETEAMPAGFIGECARADLELRHIFDSVLPAIAPESQGDFPLNSGEGLNVFDLGAGSGLPSIPLAILFPQHKFHLLDAQEKRCRFAESAAKKLGLSNVQVYHGVVQDFPKKYGTAPRADVIVFRAFRKILASLELALHVLATPAKDRQRPNLAAPQPSAGIALQSPKVLYWRSQKVPFSAAGEQRVRDLGFKTESFIKFDSAANVLPRGLYTFSLVSPAKQPYPRSWKKISADALVDTES